MLLLQLLTIAIAIVVAVAFAVAGKLVGAPPDGGFIIHLFATFGFGCQSRTLSRYSSWLSGSCLCILSAFRFQQKLAAR